MNTTACAWRYATKKFDSTKKLTQEQVEAVLDVLRMAPSSYGLQPWKFYVIENTELRAKIREHGWGQSQITDASHLLAIAYRTNVTEHDVDAYMENIKSVRGVSDESLAGFRSMILGTVNSLSVEQRMQWSARQAYLALGFVLAELSEMRIDSCPMEGFDVEVLGELLGATTQGYRVGALLPIGYRSEEDETVTWGKVRYPLEKVVVRL